MVSSTFQGDGPQFICIGPIKTGTSWLYQRLAAHPDVAMPPVKEITYFWQRAFLRSLPVPRHFVGRHWLDRDVRRKIQPWLRALAGGDHKRAAWYTRYLWRRRTDAWYLSLFHTPGKIGGDISPNYYQLPPEGIAHVRRVTPEARIVIILRDPIDRTWSVARMLLATHQGRDLATAPAALIEQTILGEVAACPSYVDLVDAWRAAFPDQQVYVAFYDQLQQDPVAFMRDLASFLAIDAAPFERDGDTLRERVNAGPRYALPPAFGALLARRYQHMLDRCVRIGWPFAAAWRAHAASYLAQEAA